MNNQTKEGGFVSIFTVLIIMMVLTLIAIGFSNITRRAQRRALDNRLNTQAFYAAEAGVNVVRARLHYFPETPQTKTNCQGDSDVPHPDQDPFVYDFDTILDTSYTCVLVNPEPTDVVLNSVPVEGNGSPKVIRFETDEHPNSFDISWGPTSGSAANIPTGTTLTPVGTWGTNLGILRIDLVPTDVLDRAALIANSYTFFLYPSTAGTSQNVTPSTTPQGQLSIVRCAAGSTSCTAHINLGGTSIRYVMRLQAIYNAVDVRLSDALGASGPQKFKNAQVVVDSTGRAVDVYRRIQVRLPIEPNGLTPAFGLATADSICKRLFTYPQVGGNPGDTTVDNPDPACQTN